MVRMDNEGVPWDGGCRVAFGVSDGYAIWDKFEKTLWRERLPKGWKVDQLDTAGARSAMVFWVECVPAVEDGRAVRRLLNRMEPRG